MDDIPARKLDEIRRDYMRRILAETGWDYREASAILKISEKFLRKQVPDIRDKSTPTGVGTTKKDEDKRHPLDDTPRHKD